MTDMTSDKMTHFKIDLGMFDRYDIPSMYFVIVSEGKRSNSDFAQFKDGLSHITAFTMWKE